jgi:hypothetical protein
VTEYSQDGQILHETKSESRPKLEQKITTAAESVFFFISLRILTILATNGKDKESRCQLKQGLKNISFFFAFVNLPATLN